MTQHRTTSFSLKLYQIIVKWTISGSLPGLTCRAGTTILSHKIQYQLKADNFFHSSVKCFHFAVLSAIQSYLFTGHSYLFLSMNCPYDKESPEF